MDFLQISEVIARVIAALFGASALLHLAAPGFLRRAYMRWHFPPNAYRVMGALDLVAALFLFEPETRLWGVVVAAMVTFSAVTMLLNNRQYVYSVPGMVLLAALVPAARSGLV